MVPGRTRWPAVPQIFAPGQMEARTVLRSWAESRGIGLPAKRWAVVPYETGFDQVIAAEFVMAAAPIEGSWLVSNCTLPVARPVAPVLPGPHPPEQAEHGQIPVLAGRKPSSDNDLVLDRRNGVKSNSCFRNRPPVAEAALAGALETMVQSLPRSQLCFPTSG